MKVLQMIDCAYRATLEEQDDTIVWLTHAIKGAGADVDVLLVGDATNYAVEDQDARGLSFGEWRQTQPPRIARDLAQLLEKGCRVFVHREDAAERGLESARCLTGLELIARDSLPALLERYEQVWRW